MCGDDNKFSEWCGCISRNVLNGLAILAFPVVCECRYVGVIWFLGAESDGAFLELGHITDDMFGTFEVAFLGYGAEAGECHDGSTDI